MLQGKCLGETILDQRGQNWRAGGLRGAGVPQRGPDCSWRTLANHRMHRDHTVRVICHRQPLSWINMWLHDSTWTKAFPPCWYHFQPTHHCVPYLHSGSLATQALRPPLRKQFAIEMWASALGWRRVTRGKWQVAQVTTRPDPACWEVLVGCAGRCGRCLCEMDRKVHSRRALPGGNTQIPGGRG